MEQAKFIRTPFGVHLQSLGILETDQLRLLFHSQVLQPVCLLFKLEDGRFAFNEKAPLGYLEMTGMSVAAVEASLLGLRVLRDYQSLEHKLPSAFMGLKKLRSELPNFKLDTQETLVWGLANGNMSLSQIAAETELPLSIVRQISFRLIVVGLVNEVSVNETSLVGAVVEPKTKSFAKNDAPKTSGFNPFTTDITGFLKKRN